MGNHKSTGTVARSFVAASAALLACGTAGAMGFVYDARDLGMGGVCSALSGPGRVAWNPAAAYDIEEDVGIDGFCVSSATFSRYEDGEATPALSGVYFPPATFVGGVCTGGAVAPVFPMYPVTYMADTWDMDDTCEFVLTTTPFKRESAYTARDAVGAPVRVTLEQRMGQVGWGIATGNEFVAVGTGTYVIYSDVEAEASNGSLVDDNIVGAMASVGAIVRLPLSGETALRFGAAYHTGGELSRDSTNSDPEDTSDNLIGDAAYWDWDAMDTRRDGVLEGWPSVATAGAALEGAGVTIACEYTLTDWSVAEPSWRATTSVTAGIEWDLGELAGSDGGLCVRMGYRRIGSPTAGTGLPERVPALKAFTFGVGTGDDEGHFDFALEVGETVNMALSWGTEF